MITIVMDMYYQNYHVLQEINLVFFTPILPKFDPTIIKIFDLPDYYPNKLKSLKIKYGCYVIKTVDCSLRTIIILYPESGAAAAAASMTQALNQCIPDNC
jgi:hypothetical protein